VASGAGTLGQSTVNEPEKGYCSGLAIIPLRTGFIQMYHATDSE